MVTNETREQLEARGWDFTDEFIPDEPTVNNQDKTVDVSENGTIEVVPDSEFTGLGKVTINTDVSTVNNQDKTVDVSENGTIEVLPDEGFTGLGKVTINTEVEGVKPKWTGHADAEGLTAIGWTDDDIAFYQENGVNWNEEDDDYHKVTDDNKALYGVLTSDNIKTYSDRIVYLPKIDTSNVAYMGGMFRDCSSLTAIPMLDTSSATTMSYMFNNCRALASIPMLDTSSVTDMSQMFSGCYTLTAIPLLDTSKVTNMAAMFSGCYSLTAIPTLNTSKVTNMDSMFNTCYSLTAIPMLDTSSATAMGYMFNNCYSLTAIPTLNTSKVRNMGTMFSGCYSLTAIPMLDTSSVTSTGSMFNNCRVLVRVNIKNIKLGFRLSNSTLLSKDSLLYIINNEAATSAMTITLASYTYDKLATDPDVVTALTNHPNVSLASA